ncbi:MAG: DUF4837 family protein [Alistipes sp.]|nr:DUF4837 family protein [Alistipes sp.]
MNSFLKNLFLFASVVSMLVGCKTINKLNTTDNATGKPYELILVCDQHQWASELGDTLQAILKQPVAELTKHEPLFDVMRILPNNFKSLVERHRNIVVVNVNPEISEPQITAKYDVTAKPQVFITIKGPDSKSVAEYVGQNSENLLYVLEKAERDRDVRYSKQYTSAPLRRLIWDTFKMDLPVAEDFLLRTSSDDMVWISQEFPTASQGFFIYKYPYTGKEALTPEALMKARNRFAQNIPGPVDGSYMITVDKISDESGENYVPYQPEYRTMKIGEQPWIEMSGLWDVENYFMGGPFVSYTTVNKNTNEVVTIDCYVYSPKLAKRNMLRELQHLVYLASFDEPQFSVEASTQQ